MNKKPVVNVILKNIATLGFVGYLPIAPGTWGSLAGVALLFAFRFPPAVHAVVMLAVIAVGIAAADRAEKVIGEHDSGHIVIDELAGMLVSSLYLPQTPLYFASAFILFRVFDILKPFPVNYMERSLDGGLGIMADDIAAGIYVNLLIHLWIALF